VDVFVATGRGGRGGGWCGVGFFGRWGERRLLGQAGQRRQPEEQPAEHPSLHRGLLLVAMAGRVGGERRLFTSMKSATQAGRVNQHEGEGVKIAFGWVRTRGSGGKSGRGCREAESSEPSASLDIVSIVRAGLALGSEDAASRLT